MHAGGTKTVLPRPCTIHLLLGWSRFVYFYNKTVVISAFLSTVNCHSELSNKPEEVVGTSKLVASSGGGQGLGTTDYCLHLI